MTGTGARFPRLHLISGGRGARRDRAHLFLYPQLKAARIVASDLAHAVPASRCSPVSGIGCSAASIGRLLLSLLRRLSSRGSTSVATSPAAFPSTLLRILLAAVLLLVGAKLIVY